MPMNPNFLCCIGAELKNSTQQTTRMSQVYLYRAFEDDTLSDMLSAGFFNAAMGIIRQDDLLLLYSPNETTAKYTYARVSSVSSSGVVIERISIEAESISVDTTGYSNLSGDNLQQIMNNLDALLTTMNDAFVRKDGTSIMSAPLKFVAGSFRGAVGPYLNGVEFYNVGSDGALGSAIARLTSTNGLTPNTDNVLDIGSATKRFKDLYIARVITAVINNGYDIAVPVTNSADTLALKSEVDTAANSGRMITDQGVWFAKMYAATIPPAADDGTNYADFSQTDGDGNPIIVIYERQSGAWVQSQTVTPPANYDGYVPVTKKIWDIVEQTGQNGGRILWNHQSKEFTPYPNIVSFEDIEITGNSTVEMPLNPVPQQIVNKDYVDGATAAFLAGKANVDMDNLTSTGKNIANWSSNVSNCITEIPQDIKLELNNGTLTLKAGSKVYVPNGAGVFDEKTTTQDITITAAGTQQVMVCVRADIANGVDVIDVSRTYSGSTNPGQTYSFWYDTTNNLVKLFTENTSTPARTESLPIAIITTTNGTITSIDQIFNGFGYIGSTVFALPGVKGLIPDGRNADGSLKSITYVTSSVLTRTFTTSEHVEIILESSGGFAKSGWFTLENDGYLYDASGNKKTGFSIAKLLLVSGKITSFTPKTVFHAVDYNEADFVVSFQRPTAANNYTWYRKYKSGWVEQGGCQSASNTAINLPIAMADTHYTATITANIASGITQGQAIQIAEKTATTLKAVSFQTGGYTVNWQVSGIAA